MLQTSVSTGLRTFLALALAGSGGAILAGCAGVFPAGGLPAGLLGRPDGPSPAIPAAGAMAPDDRGDPQKHHDYTVRTGGGDSTFVWVPRFTAYQLLKADSDLPRGAWVGSMPAGVESEDWARETFGGFYSAKYEAGRSADGTAVVARGVAPWVEIEWGEAGRASEAMVPGKSHLLRGDEWTALAVWSAIHGVPVDGNTKFGRSGADPAITFEIAGERGAALTGTGNRPDWSGGRNLTSHTGAVDGVFDLVGNVREWDGAVLMAGYEYVIDGRSTGLGGTAPGYVTSLHTDPLLRKFGIAGGTSRSPAGTWFLGDAFHVAGFPVHGDPAHGKPAAAGDPAREFRTNRGGYFENGHDGEVAQAGMWLLCINREQGYRSPDQGFRPALRF